MAKPTRRRRSGENEEAPSGSPKFFLVDIGYDEGEDFCKNLLASGDFSGELLKGFTDRGSKSLPKDGLASHVASRISNEEIDVEDFALAYCRQPRQWLCVRFGTKGRKWPTKRTAAELLTQNPKREAGFAWYGPFGHGDERWYVVTKQVRHLIDMGDEGFKFFPMRWQLVVQVTPQFAAVHWFNASTREKENLQTPVQFPYWRYIDDVFGDLREILDGEWDRESPNLADIILHSAFDKYTASDEHEWIHRAVRSSYESVALNASGSATGNRDERAASGLQILTSELARTAAKAIGKGSDARTIEKMEHALLRMILREWGTKSYEFILNDLEKNPIARMRVYFGGDLSKEGRQTQDTVQHVHCFAKYGFSAGALQFILEECAVAEGQDQREDPMYEDP